MSQFSLWHAQADAASINPITALLTLAVLIISLSFVTISLVKFVLEVWTGVMRMLGVMILVGVPATGVLIAVVRIL